MSVVMGAATSRDVGERLGVSSSYAAARLGELARDGQLRVVGRRRTASGSGRPANVYEAAL